MNETDIQNSIRIALSYHGIVFRTNAGTLYQGDKRFSNEFRETVIVNPRPVKMLPKGFSDLMFFGDDGQAAFIEVKTAKGKASQEQLNFIKAMQSRGFRAGIARSVEDALKIIE